MGGEPYDLAIVGGGINGTGIAADAAGRGLKVVLFERGDLAEGTSSASSKLIHGGLRYLEHGEFRLVREALLEREVLLARAPHLIHPLRFIIPHTTGMRPRALTRLGLFLYDHLAARRRVPGSAAVDLKRDPAGRPLTPTIAAGFSYYDCAVDDARLVVLLAVDAAARGARIVTRAPVTRATRREGLWEVTSDTAAGPTSIAARVLVNAAGPWCTEVARLAGDATAPALRLVRGAHIVVPRIAGADDAYLLQNDDGRIVFVLPFEERFTLIGTTEVSVGSAADGFVASEAETDYLLAATARFFAHPPSRADVVWRFAGVRPLVEDGARSASAISRDYRLDLDEIDDGPPLLNVIGGKITTFRRLAEAALDRLAAFFPGMGPPWTAAAPLPGGAFGGSDFAGYCEDLVRRHPAIARETLQGLARRYGTRADEVIGDAAEDADLGAAIGSELTAREVIYLRDAEWARTPDDVLWRRTKAGLHIGALQIDTARQHIAEVLASP
ncbi:glycerol-3-phosphate dehydrogenase [Hyphomicrobium sp. CS1GBMeth3]|uniref:glycerol-3-phosphate dehydrogenase n=1 Tax=Hyphomicrobium sp. CS1GBMeth3 TaxID=1892845 RepID=UPI000930CD6B|nr:glycerol-3-phosphate dehydrogenase [Hyphomicrobium sp. CS1GBMeth3]